MSRVASLAITIDPSTIAENRSMGIKISDDLSGNVLDLRGIINNAPKYRLTIDSRRRIPGDVDQLFDSCQRY